MPDFLGLSNINEALEEAKRDNAVGIKIAKLTGNDAFAFYAAEIDPQKRVGAHYHREGLELYQIIAGKGQIYTGSPKDNGEVEWQEPLAVKVGDCFTINAKQAHQLVNTGSEKLIIIFACPYTHISTDRIIVTGVKQE